MLKRILVVCVGNICRSPMAEALLKQLLNSKNLDICVSSAGLAACENLQAAESAQALMKARNIDISLHRARQLTEEHIINSDLVLTMEIEHKREILKLYPYAHGKVFLIGEWGRFEIPDPYKRSKQDFEYALDLIDQGLKDWQKRLCV